jgi:hypothetical protein
VTRDEVEPIELEPLAVDSPTTPPPGNPFRISRIWIVVLAVGVACWIGIAAFTRKDRSTSAPAPLPIPATTATPSPPAALGNAFWNGLDHIGSGRFAAIVDNKLIVYDHGARNYGLPAGSLSIEAQSGDALAVRVNGVLQLVQLDLGLVQELGYDRYPLAAEPDHWWVVRNDGAIQKDGAGAATRVPAGLHVLAPMNGGWLADDSTRNEYVVWSGASTTPLAPVASRQLLAATADSAAFRSNCSALGCDLEIWTRRGEVVSHRFPDTAFAGGAFAPDGVHLAVETTDNQIWILDRAAHVLTSIRDALPYSSAFTFTWSATSDALLIVTSPGLVVVPTTGAATRNIATSDLQQIVALP